MARRPALPLSAQLRAQVAEALVERIEQLGMTQKDTAALLGGGEGADAGVSSAAADGEDDREARRARTRRALYWVPRAAK